ncbi:hypothetical protein ISCGN_005120 [Ixodes scapularis]
MLSSLSCATSISLSILCTPCCSAFPSSSLASVPELRDAEKKGGKHSPVARRQTGNKRSAGGMPLQIEARTPVRALNCFSCIARTGFFSSLDESRREREHPSQRSSSKTNTNEHEGKTSCDAAACCRDILFFFLFSPRKAPNT